MDDSDARNDFWLVEGSAPRAEVINIPNSTAVLSVTRTTRTTGDVLMIVGTSMAKETFRNPGLDSRSSQYLMKNLLTNREAAFIKSSNHKT